MYMQYVWFPCGIIRGALASLGVPTVVVAETSNLPQCNIKLRVHTMSQANFYFFISGTFQIKIVKQQ